MTCGVFLCVSYLYQKQLEPSKQCVQTLHLGSPIASIKVSRVLNWRISSSILVKFSILITFYFLDNTACDKFHIAL